MTDEILAGYKPAPMSSRFWSWLGFGTCRAPRADADENRPGYAPGWFITGTYVCFDWKDRLRLIISGKVMVEQAIKTDVLITKSYSVSVASVLRPDFHPSRHGFDKDRPAP